MKDPYKPLRTIRKQHSITQTDVAYLLNLKRNSNVSRYENGKRPPTIDVILAYHLLFETELGAFLTEHREHIKNRIVSRIVPRIAEIEREPFNPQAPNRIAFLKKTLNRLNNNSS